MSSKLLLQCAPKILFCFSLIPILMIIGCLPEQTVSYIHFDAPDVCVAVHEKPRKFMISQKTSTVKIMNFIEYSQKYGKTSFAQENIVGTGYIQFELGQQKFLIYCDKKELQIYGPNGRVIIPANEYKGQIIGLGKSGVIMVGLDNNYELDDADNMILKNKQYYNIKPLPTNVPGNIKLEPIQN